jgi:hypothetical protein
MSSVLDIADIAMAGAAPAILFVIERNPREAVP